MVDDSSGNSAARQADAEVAARRGAQRLEIAPLERADREFMLEMILEAWDYRDWVPERAVRAMGEYYVYELLADSDAAWVARLDGERAGVLAAGDRRAPARHPIFRLRQRLTGWRLGRVAEFREFERTQRLDGELRAQCPEPFDAELTLLITGRGFQGRGVGGALYAQFERWLRGRGLSSFYLFTDSSCDFAFYERRGVRRLASRMFYWPDEAGEPRFPEEYYLYGGRI